MSEIKTAKNSPADDYEIIVDDSDMDDYFVDEDAVSAPVEEQLDEEAENFSASVPLTSEEEQELALRDQLEGKGYTADDFRSSRNYLVEAGAGAGKTYIMIQRIVNQLVSGYCQPKDIAAITFTKKSTLEMQERLDKELKQRRDELHKQECETGLSSGERERLARLERLIRETGQMQISTIHSFCQTMLESMPFASKLGLDMRVMESDEVYARDFLKRKWWEEKQPFEVPRQLGVPANVLNDIFWECCQNSEAELGYQDVNSPEAVKWKSELKDAVHNLQRELHALPNIPQEIRENIRSIIEKEPTEFAQETDLIRTLIWESLTNPAQFPLDWNIKDKKVKDAVWKRAESQAVTSVWTGHWGQLLRTCAQHLIHAYVMRDTEALLEEYRAEKTARHIATYNDLLLRARDMLKESREARAYFHGRYKVIYVDEMQDTDPVQTEMLFYLTTNEEDFDPVDWKNCKPIPGSLFLVGDPKQAIYRFRGADIGVYNDLLSIFRTGEDIASGAAAVGEKVTLRFNFRSSANICALADRAFRPVAGAQIQQPHRFVGGTYHAQYVSMNARSGNCPRARTLTYYARSTESDNPGAVAAFIHMMIKNGRYVGVHRPDKEHPEKGRYAHPAQPEDFLILTRSRKEALKYAKALRALNIAAEVSGKKKFQDTKPITRAVLHLESLLSLRDDQKLLLVLQECYGLEIEQLRVFMQRTGERSLTGAAKANKLAPIQRALEAEPVPDNDLLAVCAALEEIAALRKMARNQPAMAVIERLLEGGYGVWQGEEETELAQRRQIWAEVQQYLNLVRSSGERSFRALASFAAACAQQEVEHELGLEPSGKAVRIMNLHKAKGLEGEVVILACGWQKDFTVSRYVERSGNKSTEHRLLTYGGRNNLSVIGCPVNWEDKAAEEEKHQAAEYARLMYVAATRAKTMLLVCDKNPARKAWADKTSYWAPLTAELKSGIADETDPYYGKAFKMLSTTDKKELPKPKVSQASPVPMDPAALEEALQTCGEQLSKNETYAITPSRLEKHARGVLVHKDKDAEDLAAAQADETTKQPGADDDEDDIPTTVAEGAAAPQQNTAADHAPFGPVWGTMVHRVMELCVQGNTYTESALQESARQAVHEMLTNDEMDKKQRGMLGLAEDASDEEVLSWLVPKIVAAAGFLKNENSRLRKLLANGVAYPELPFILRAKKDDTATGELYQHLSQHIRAEAAQDRVLAVEGIIDLAVCKDGGWYVVDYKTDKLNDGESTQAYMQRLKMEYTPQITAYARVLEKMNPERALPVKEAWLCSIPLGGDLIKLDIKPKNT